MAFGDGLKQRGLADVGETDDTTLQVVARTTQEDLFFDGSLFWWHFLTAAFRFRVVASCDMEESWGDVDGVEGVDGSASKRNGGVVVVIVVGIGEKKKGRTRCGR